MGIFDPLFIIYQIISLQCAYYVAMGTIWGVCHVVFENPISLDHFFTSKHISFVTLGGWIDILCTFLSAIIGYTLLIIICHSHSHLTSSFFSYILSCRSYLLYIIVERSKKCVDFTFTLYFIHILACTFYYQVIVSILKIIVDTYISLFIPFYSIAQFPLEWEWWLTMVVSSVAMASLGEYLCARAELEDIPLYSNT